MPHPELVEFEVLPGLIDLAANELRRRLTARQPGFDLDEVATTRGPADGTVLQALWSGPLDVLLDLRTVVAVHLVLTFDVPRPRALLGDEAMRLIGDGLDEILDLHPSGTFHGLRLGAAGSDSAVMQRLGRELARHAGVPMQPDGDLLVRIRRGSAAPEGEDRHAAQRGGAGPVRPAAGWDVLIRLTPRPLATRAWRTAGSPSALNATIAAAMVSLAEVRPGEHVANLMCGTGTLLVEGFAAEPGVRLVGVDIDAVALESARANLDAAGVDVPLVRGDATDLPLAAASLDCVVSDLPYGHRSGSHATNEALYPAFLAAAHQAVRPHGRMVVITHELRRFQAALNTTRRWRTEHERQVFQKGHHPRIWVLRAQSAS